MFRRKVRPPDVYQGPTTVAASKTRVQKLTVTTAQIIMQNYLPRGWLATTTETYNGSRAGLCDFERKLIWCPRMIDVDTLHVFLHECCHAKFHRRVAAKDWVSHIREWEAETYAMKELRHLGFRVPRVTLLKAKRYVWDCIGDDQRAGLKINRRIYHWAHPSAPAKRRIAKRRQLL